MLEKILPILAKYGIECFEFVSGEQVGTFILRMDRPGSAEFRSEVTAVVAPCVIRFEAIPTTAQPFLPGFAPSQVTHPLHYNSGKIEVIEFIEDQGFGSGFCRGSAIKYIARAGRKDPTKEIEDLEKAHWYIEREIERLRAAREKRDAIRPNDMRPRSPAHGCMMGQNGPEKRGIA